MPAAGRRARSCVCCGGFFAGDVQNLSPGSGQRGEGLEQERGLADAGLAAEEDGRAGHDAAAQDAVEFGQGGVDARDVEGRNLGDGGGFGVKVGAEGVAVGTGGRGGRVA